MEPLLRVNPEAVTEDGYRITVSGEVDAATVGGLSGALTDTITGPPARGDDDAMPAEIRSALSSPPHATPHPCRR
jgi:hypothetical protein